MAGRHPARLIRLDHFQRLRAHVVRIRRIAVCASPIEALIRPDACRLHVVTIQEVHHAALHLGNRFWMVNRIAVRVFRKAGISQLVIHRDAVAVIIEMIEQLLAAQVVRNYRQAVLIRIGTVIRSHIAASHANALHAEGLTGRVILICHLDCGPQKSVFIIGIIQIFGSSRNLGGNASSARQQITWLRHERTGKEGNMRA